MIRWLITIFAGLLGLAFGSFLNVCVSRWPMGESIVQPASHCWACDRPLRWWENVPLVSWLALRGRCPTCGAPISIRYFIAEATVGIAWAFAAWNGWNAAFPAAQIVGLCYFLWVLVALAVLDAEFLWLPDALTVPGIIVGFLWWLMQAELAGWRLHTLKQPWGDAGAIGERLLAIVVAAGIIFAIRGLYWLVRRREGIGLGDAKLMAMLGAWLGLSGALLALGIGVVLGALAGLVLLVFPRARVDDETWAATKLPLGTFLCAGGIVASLWGGPIVDAYLRWAGLI
ncbi:MAG: prepilin peptidase [Acidobacteriota bacterium]